MISNSLTPGFLPLDVDADVYFFDTNVWTSVLSSDIPSAKLNLWLEENNVVIALSIFTAFELSRAKKMITDLDSMMSDVSSRIYIPLLYDELFFLEFASYPNNIEMLWMPFASLMDNGISSLLSKFSKDPRFTSKRQEYLDFGETNFMNLEKFKENFPPEENGTYTTEQAELFAWGNSVDYLGRYFPKFLTRFKNNASSLKTERIPSLHIRGLFLFYKYYIYGQSPSRSDFLDFAHVSYVPYLNGYITERNVLNILKHIKSQGSNLVKLELIHVTEFVRELEN